MGIDIKSQDVLKQCDDTSLLDEYIYVRAYIPTVPAQGTSEFATKALTDYQSSIENMLYDRGYTKETLAVEADMREQMIKETPSDELLSDSAVNYKFLADAHDTQADLIEEYMNLSVSERETTIRFKSQLEGETKQAYSGENTARWDYVSDDDKVVLNEGLPTECTITKVKDGVYHCESEYLGDFDYSTDDFAIGYKEIPGTESENPDGSLTKLPVLKYVGDVEADAGHAAGFEEGVNLNPFVDGGMSGANRTQQVEIPDGVKCLDYTFEGNEELQLVPGFPESVESAHCCFKDCTRLHGESHEFKTGEGVLSNGGGSWDLSENFKDASGMFSGCSELGDISIGKLPSGLLTIDGMFEGCPQVLDEKLSWIESHTLIGPKGKDADYSECPNLLDPFRNPVDTSTSDAFKRNAEREEQELKKFQEDIDWSKETPEAVEEHQDAVAASVAEKGLETLDATVTVPDLDMTSKDDINTGSGIQSTLITAGTGLGIYAVSGLFTDSKLVRLGLGVGGALLLRSSGVLPESFEPVLQMVKNIMPESMKPMMDSLIEKVHIDSKEDIAAVYADQMDRYTNVALDKSLQSLDVAGGVTNESLAAALQANGHAVAYNGVMLNIGQDGEESAKPVGDFVKEALAKGEHAWDARLAEKGADKEAIAEDMRHYYMGLMQGLEAYDKGALTGIGQAHGDKIADLQTAQDGLTMVNREYTQAVMDSMLAYNEKVPFLTQEDYAKLDALEISGVGALSKYKKGGMFSVEAAPVYDQPALDASKSQTTESAPQAQSQGQTQSQVSQGATPQQKPQQTASASADDVRSRRVRDAEAMSSNVTGRSDSTYEFA